LGGGFGIGSRGELAEVFTDDGWFRMGDLRVIDARGCLSIRGRLKTMILGASGENIHPEEVEVLESLVAKVQDGIAKAEASINGLLECIRREVNAQLASFSRVARVELQRIPFEKTPTQKIKRFLYPRRD
jgi:long-chain acyl-CoA synthetase